jgi:twinkle protein
MLMQYFKLSDLSLLSKEQIHLLANDFEDVPLFFLSYFGGTDIDEVLDAMDFAVYKYDVENIIIDNLQFMMPRKKFSYNFDKFDAQDSVIDKFRKFATDKQVNVIVVIHPRKEEEDTKLSLASVFGTGKATQEADIVMILQRVNGVASIDVKKNRYDGELGSVPLAFSRATTSYYEVAKDDKSQIPPEHARRGVVKKSPS